VDLADYQKIKGIIRSFAYILIIVDNFTKLIYARGLKSKSAEHVAEAFKDIYKKLKPIGSRIQAVFVVQMHIIQDIFSPQSIYCQNLQKKVKNNFRKVVLCNESKELDRPFKRHF
jgi:hypothetical protein